MFKPPKMFHTKSAETPEAPAAPTAFAPIPTASTPIEGTQAEVAAEPMEYTAVETAPAETMPPEEEQVETTLGALEDTPTEETHAWSPTTEPPTEFSESSEQAGVQAEVQAEEPFQPAEEPVSFAPEQATVATTNEWPTQEQTTTPAAPQIEDDSRFARPTESSSAQPSEQEPTEDPISSASAGSNETPQTSEWGTVDQSETPESSSTSPEKETPSDTIKRVLGDNQKVVRVESLNSIPFSDIWYTAEKIAYIRDNSTKFALIPFESEDLEEFYKALEQGYTGNSSYAVRFAGEQYRVERIITLSGPQYNCRKMPGEVPDIYTLGLPKHVVDYLVTLSHESGLILFGGPTGMGKTTSASALMKKFLEMDGGFMYTIEDPPEMPLDGLYHAANGGLGLCKQCPVDNERWGDGIKSALRSRPRYILVGEIRTPETASQVLRAATSGHLVLSTIHASTVEDALESLIKYASGAGLTESLAADLLARGILAVVHQKLEGSDILRPVLTSAFANPQLTGGDQMRSLIRNQTINLQTLIEAQSSRLFQGRPLFSTGKEE